MRPDRSARGGRGGERGSERPPGAIDLALELLFYGFRGVTAEADRVLAGRGLSRVHHRVLYFVRRHPGIRPGALLDVLRVSKQALSRPLRDLVGQGLVAASVPPENRRTKALRLTAAGTRLELRLSGSERARFARAFRAAGPAGARGWREVMRSLARDQAPSRRRT
ncbi:MAG TPA: MarR family transcriptional regulator [Anaeromyxobacteraceae bacterium]|nr:MarR family transcriptional regulator [Anaeromyxobacteraceae bacterium]